MGELTSGGHLYTHQSHQQFLPAKIDTRKSHNCSWKFAIILVKNAKFLTPRLQQSMFRKQAATNTGLLTLANIIFYMWHASLGSQSCSCNMEQKSTSKEGCRVLLAKVLPWHLPWLWCLSRLLLPSPLYLQIVVLFEDLSEPDCLLHSCFLL